MNNRYDLLCLPEGDGGVGGWGHSQPCADAEGLPHGSQAPQHPDPSVDTPPHGVGGVTSRRIGYSLS